MSDQVSILPEVSLGLSRLGWVPPVDHVNFDQWLGILDAASAVERASPWWIGDLVNYAMAQGKDFEDRAFQAMPYENQTLRNYAVIARLFPPAKRRGNLTIRHHAAVAKIARKDMEEAERLLERAETESLSAADLREELTQPARPAVEASETEPSDTSDWKDALLAEAADFMRRYIDLEPTAANWLFHYESQTGEVKETGDNQR